MECRAIAVCITKEDVECEAIAVCITESGTCVETEPVECRDSCVYN